MTLVAAASIAYLRKMANLKDLWNNNLETITGIKQG